MLVGLPLGVVGLAILFYFILVYFCNMHQVLVGLPQGVDGRAFFFIIIILFYLSLFL
jgi:hypothetical protein